MCVSIYFLMVLLELSYMFNFLFCFRFITTSLIILRSTLQIKNTSPYSTIMRKIHHELVS